MCVYMCVCVCVKLLAVVCTCPTRYHREFENEVRELQQQKTELELQFPSLCLPDPDLAGIYVHLQKNWMHTYLLHKPLCTI